MVFRKENKADAFQRQISALRQQLGGSGEEQGEPTTDPAAADQRASVDTASAFDPFARPNSGGYGFGDGLAESGDQPGTSTALPQTAPLVPPMPVVDAQTTVIAHDTTWKGEISSEGTVHVHGRFEGSLRAKNDIYIAEEADVDATLIASNVVIAGLTKGSVRCGARFEVLPSGRVTGDIQSPTLVVHEGANVSGQFRMGAGEGTETPSPAVAQPRRAARGSS